MNFSLGFGGPLLKLRPLWSFVAGFLASGSSLSPLQFFLLLFLVEGVMPGWWSSLEALFSGNLPPILAANGKTPILPYAIPGSIAWKAANALGRAITWWKEVFWPERGKALVSWLFFTALALSLTLSQRTEIWPVLMLATALGVAGIISSKHGKEPAPWKALYEISLPWLVGEAAGRNIGLLSFASAIAFGFVAWGMEERRTRWHEGLVFGPLGLLFLSFWFSGKHLLAGGLACLMLGLLGAERQKRHHLLLLALTFTALALR